VHVWEWSATSPGDWSGITDDPARARARAEERLRDGRATTAQIERAFAVVGGGAMQSHYNRSGFGWMGTLDDAGAVIWVPCSPPAEQPAS
jgi:hypothetical protein